MNALVEDLLRLARVGHAEVKHADLDLSQMCKQIVDELRATSPRLANVQIAEGITCRADEGLMRVALTNLLGNAWKFTTRRPRTEIDIRLLEPGVLRVRDNGAGFDMKDSRKLFGAFQRLHRDDEFPGTGVGLATVHRIVERHGGRIWAESAPDAGATFYVGLPSLRVQPHS